jgi:hypothetical protein
VQDATHRSSLSLWSITQLFCPFGILAYFLRRTLVEFLHSLAATSHITPVAPVDDASLPAYAGFSHTRFGEILSLLAANEPTSILSALSMAYPCCLRRTSLRTRPFRALATLIPVPLVDDVSILPLLDSRIPTADKHCGSSSQLATRGFITPDLLICTLS